MAIRKKIILDVTKAIDGLDDFEREAIESANKEQRAFDETAESLDNISDVLEEVKRARDAATDPEKVKEYEATINSLENEYEDLGDSIKDVNDATKEERRRQKALRRGIGRLTEGFTDLWLVVKKYKKTLLAIGASSTAIIVAAIVAALGAASVALHKFHQNIVSTAHQYENLLGPAVQKTNEFLENYADVLGLSTRKGQKFLSNIASIGLGMGKTQQEAAQFTVQVAKLAGNLSTYLDLPFKKTSKAVTAAITGQYEALRKLGVNIDKVAVKQKAMAMFSVQTADALTDQQKVMAALAVAQANATEAAGNMNDTLAKQGKTLGEVKADALNLATALSNSLSGVFQKTVKALDWIVQGLTDWLTLDPTQQIKAQQAQLKVLVARITSANIKTKTRKELIQKLQDIYPDFLKNLDASKVTNGQIADRLKDVNEQLRERIVLQKQMARFNAAKQHVQNLESQFKGARTALLRYASKLNVNLAVGENIQLTGRNLQTFKGLKNLLHDINKFVLKYQYEYIKTFDIQKRNQLTAGLPSTAGLMQLQNQLEAANKELGKVRKTTNDIRHSLGFLPKRAYDFTQAELQSKKTTKELRAELDRLIKQYKQGAKKASNIELIGIPGRQIARLKKIIALREQSGNGRSGGNDDQGFDSLIKEKHHLLDINQKIIAQKKLTAADRKQYKQNERRINQIQDIIEKRKKQLKLKEKLKNDLQVPPEGLDMVMNLFGGVNPQGLQTIGKGQVSLAHLKKVRDYMRNINLQIITAQNNGNYDLIPEIKEKALKHLREVYKILKDFGLLTPKLKKQFNEYFQSLGKDTKDSHKHLKKLGQTLDSVAGAASGIANLAEQFGFLSDEASEALQAISNIAGGASNLALGIASGNPASIISGVIQLGSGIASLFSIGPSKEELRQLTVAIQDNIRALRENTKAFQQKAIQGSQINPEIFKEFDRRYIQLIKSGNYVDNPYKPGLQKNAILTSISKAKIINFLKWLEDTFPKQLSGIVETYKKLRKKEPYNLNAFFHIMEGFENIKGLKDFEGVKKIINRTQKNLGNVGQSVTGAVKLFTNSIKFGAKNVNEAFDKAIDIILESFDGLSSKLKMQFNKLANFDLTTEKGRKKANKLQEKIYQEFIKAKKHNNLDTFLGTMTVDQFLSSLNFVDRAISKGQSISGSAGTISRSTQVANSITEVQANEVVFFLQRIEHWTRTTAAALTGAQLPAAMIRHAMQNIQAAVPSPANISIPNPPAPHHNYNIPINVNGNLTPAGIDELTRRINRKLKAEVVRGQF